MTPCTATSDQPVVSTIANGLLMEWYCRPAQCGDGYTWLSTELHGKAATAPTQAQSTVTVVIAINDCANERLVCQTQERERGTDRLCAVCEDRQEP